RAFDGESAASVIADVIHKEPRPLSEQQPLIPVGLDRVVRTCLAKDPESRWQTARDVKHALDWAASDTPPAAVEAPGKSRGVAGWSVAGMVVLALPPVWWMRPKPDLPAIELDVTPPEGVSFGAVRAGDHRFTVSPDGRKVVFVAYGKDGTGKLYLRPLDSGAATPLAGTEGASSPFWAPDSRWLGFAANGKLQKIDTMGGAPQMICGECAAVAGTWNRDGVVLFEQRGKPIQQVRASGGSPAVVVPKEEWENNPDQRDPQ